MHKLLTTLLLLSALGANAQYFTPGTGEEIDLQYLVENSAGTVTMDGEDYLFNNSVTITGSDTLLIQQASHLKLAADVLIDIEGSFIVNADTTTFLPQGESPFAGLRFEIGSFGHIQNSLIKNGGGIRVITETFIIENSEVAFQEPIAATGGAIALSRGNPRIVNCYIHDNVKSAISSPVNIDAAPLIENCTLISNVTQNSNRPQINLGPSGEDTTIIRNNTITGNPDFDQAGGIGVGTIIGGLVHAVVEGNTVKDNRYGLAYFGADIFTRTIDNEFIDNNTQGLPNLGGSGLNLNNAGTNMHYIANNLFSGNLWGITMQDEAMANLGDTASASYNPGGNIFENNTNGGNTYALYNNTPNDVSAMNNCWMGQMEITPAQAEEVISHSVDNPELGTVTFQPLGCPALRLPQADATEVARVYPNPASGQLTISWKKPATTVKMTDIQGRQVMAKQVQANAATTRISLSAFPKGVYMLEIIGENYTAQQRVVVR